MRYPVFLCLLVALAGAGPARAATIVIVNNDGAGEGFNDPTPVAPVGGNPGTTLGEQRLNVFQEAADIWGALLPSAVTIRVQAQFNAQACDAGSAVLGSAGPIEIFRDFPGAEVAGTWHHVALANRLAGVDLSASNDINATFNSSIDNNDDCLAGTNWYYGLDGNEGIDVELLPVVLHELGHGLGFSTLVNLGSGVEFNNFPDLYETFLFDTVLGLHWDEMNNPQRASSADGGNVSWDGPQATADAACYLGGIPTMFVNSPPALPTTIPVGSATFGPELTEAGVTGDVVLVDDGTGTTTDGCESLVNGGSVSGNIALIDRGTCTFVSKALNAQAAGAIAVIIANNQPDPEPITLGGSDPTVVIPVVSITQADGDAIKTQLGAGVNVTLALDPSNLAGADAAGRVKIYSPNPVESGSSISHWDVSALPNLLMEPAISNSLSGTVDLTISHFADLGWVSDTDPVAVCKDTTISPAGSCAATVAAEDLNDGSYDPRGGSLSFALDPPGPYGDGVHVVDFVVTDACGASDTCQATITVDCSVTDAGPPVVPSPVFAVSPAFPTPFAAAAEIRFSLPEPDEVRADVFDSRGRRVRGLLAPQTRPAGDQAIRWDGKDDSGRPVAGGLYFVRVATAKHGSKVVRAIRVR